MDDPKNCPKLCRGRSFPACLDGVEGGLEGSRFPCCVLSYFSLVFVMGQKLTNPSHKSQLSRAINYLERSTKADAELKKQERDNRPNEDRLRGHGLRRL